MLFLGIQFESSLNLFTTETLEVVRSKFRVNDEAINAKQNILNAKQEVNIIQKHQFLSPVVIKNKTA